MDSNLKTLERDGRIWFRNALNSADITNLQQACFSGQKHGTRIAWDSHQASVLHKVTNLHKLVSQFFPDAKPVRAVVFNKSLSTNWVVPWHQDRVIAVKGKHEVKGFKNWTKKSGIWHVEPPTSILNNMVFVRVHLNASTKENGCMEIALGSHKFGKIPPNAIEKSIRSSQTELCLAQKGDVLVLKALTLHRSGQSSLDDMRSVLRVDYSSQELPTPLQWAALK